MDAHGFQVEAIGRVENLLLVGPFRDGVVVEQPYPPALGEALCDSAGRVTVDLGAGELDPPDLVPFAQDQDFLVPTTFVRQRFS